MFKLSLGDETRNVTVDAARTEAILAYGMGGSSISNESARAIAGAEYEWSRANVNVFSLIQHGKGFDPAVAIKIIGERIRLLHAPGVMSDVRLDTDPARLIGLLMLVSTIAGSAIKYVVHVEDSKNTAVR